MCGTLRWEVFFEAADELVSASKERGGAVRVRCEREGSRKRACLEL